MRTLLLAPVGSSMKKRVANFGVELEVLPEGETLDSEERYCDDCDEYDCGCYDGGSSDRPQAFMNAMYEAGLIVSPEDVHSYHCDCDTCDYTRSKPLMHAQRDCTVGIEFISRIISSEREPEVLDELVKAYETGVSRSGWRPNGSDANGNHIHVSRTGKDDGNNVRFRPRTMDQAKHLCSSLVSVGNWEDVAKGGCARLRGYNSKPRKEGSTRVIERDGGYGYSDGNWIAQKTGTMEFRLWNTPAIASRIKAHVGLSIGMSRWAFTQVITDRERLMEMPMMQFSDLVTKQLDDVKEVILEAVPAYYRPESAEALELLGVT